MPSKRRVLSALWAANINSFRPDSTFREFVEDSQDSDMGDGLGTFEGIELSNGSTIDKEDMEGNSDTSNYVVRGHVQNPSDGFDTLRIDKHMSGNICWLY